MDGTPPPALCRWTDSSCSARKTFQQEFVGSLPKPASRSIVTPPTQGRWRGNSASVALARQSSLHRHKAGGAARTKSHYRNCKYSPLVIAWNTRRNSPKVAMQSSCVTSLEIHEHSSSLAKNQQFRMALRLPYYLRSQEKRFQFQRLEAGS